jgi:hypothetical protein
VTDQAKTDQTVVGVTDQTVVGVTDQMVLGVMDQAQMDQMVVGVMDRARMDQVAVTQMEALTTVVETMGQEAVTQAATKEHTSHPTTKTEFTTMGITT